MLEKLIDHQIDIERRSGLEVNPHLRRQLEGRDFRGLVTDGDPFFPWVTTVKTIGKGWDGFTIALHAVTRFGQGLGGLIQSKQTIVTTCAPLVLRPNRKVPFGRPCIGSERSHGKPR